MPVRRRPLPVLLGALVALVLATGMAHGSEAGEAADREAKVDKSDPEQLFALAQWCDQNGLKTKALKYYNLVVKIDKDHEGARTALGMVKVGDHWVPTKIAGGKATTKGGEGGGDADVPESSRLAKGKGPTAAEVKWDLTVPKEPKQDEFVQKYIDRLSGIANDSDEMSNAVATMMMEEHLASSISRLAKGYLDHRLTDLYGACDLIIALEKTGHLDVAKPLLPFLVKGSEQVTDPEDLASFCFVTSMFHDKRVIPRLIELMDNANADVKTAATDALSALTLLPSASLTSARATQWWDLNHNVSEQQIYSEQLNSHDPTIAVQAARALYAYRDKAIVPVLIRLVKSDDRAVSAQAIEVVRKISGNEWGYEANGNADAKKKVADRIEAWWKEEQFRWIWIEDREALAAKAAAAAAGSASSASTDPNIELVNKLASVAGNEAQQAEASLRSTGEKAVPALIGGLEDAGPLIRRKSADLLREISKQDIPFDPRGEPADRAKGVAAWRAWAEKKGLMSAAPAAGAEDGAAAGGDETGDGEQPAPKAAPRPALKKPQPAPQDPAKKPGPEKGKVPGAL